MTDPIEEFLAGYSPDMQAVSRTLRAMVKHAMPQANEVLFARDNHFAYGMSESMRDRIVYICPMRDYVRLGFMFGTHLADPGQMLGFGGPPPPPPDTADAPPDLFTAIQQQLGLRLESTKAPVDVLAIDRVEKPSEN